MTHAGQIWKTKAPDLPVRRFCLYLLLLCGLCGSLSFCPSFFHHFRNASLGSSAETTSSPATPSIAWYSQTASSSSVATLQSRNCLLQTVFFFS